MEEQEVLEVGSWELLIKDTSVLHVIPLSTFCDTGLQTVNTLLNAMIGTVIIPWQFADYKISIYHSPPPPPRHQFQRRGTFND